MKNRLCKLTIIAGTVVLSIGAENPATAQTIAGGSDHSLFICYGGIPKSCGWNDEGQLGDGTTVDKSTIASVGSLSDVIAVEAGFAHSLFLKSNGTVWSCGYNIGGQLGDGTTINRSNPVQVIGLTGITAISAGRNQSLFLKSNGTVWACGYNGFGELGDGTTTQRPTPVQISSLSGIIAIAAGGMPTVGDFSLFLKNDGTVWATGLNTWGALGDGTNIERHTPVQVANLHNVVAIAAGANHSIFLKNDGTVWTCGYNAAGQLGNGNINAVSNVVQVTPLSNVTAVAAGFYHSLFLKSDGTVWGCGSNFSGQLGDGTTTSTFSPVHAISLAGVQSIACGEKHSLFLKTDGTVWATGDDSKGQMGIGIDANPHPVAVQVGGLCPVTNGLKEENVRNSVSAYPNPFSTQVTLNFDNDLDNASISIIDVHGRIVKEIGNISGPTVTLQRDGLSIGVYTIIMEERGVKACSKIVVTD